jgi:hypothetical protein
MENLKNRKCCGQTSTKYQIDTPGSQQSCQSQAFHPGKIRE